MVFQAKKFVESCPQVVKGDIGKEEADKLKAALEAVGATCEISQSRICYHFDFKNVLSTTVEKDLSLLVKKCWGELKIQ